MIRFVCGPKGSGKTKRLIRMANDDLKSIDGGVVFIDADDSHMLNLNHEIRYVNAREFNINNIDVFRGFLCGIIAKDYDIQKIYIDGIHKMLEIDVQDLKDLVQKKAEKYNVSFTIGLDTDEVELSDEIKDLVIS